MPLFKSLKYITCGGKEYVPGQVVPDAESFPNLREMIDYRFLGYATDKEIEDYHAKKDSLEAAEKAKAAEKAALEKKAAEEAELAEKTAAEEAAKKAAEKDNPKK